MEKVRELKEAARDEDTELNTEEQGMNRVTERAGRSFGKAKGNPDGRQYTYAGAGAKDGSAAEKPCRNCGRQHDRQEKCPAAGQSCHNCKKVGQLKAQCRPPAANSAGAW